MIKQNRKVKIIHKQKQNLAYVDKDVFGTMLAATKKRTILSNKKRHFCQAHKKFVDGQHFEECELISGFGSPTKYNYTLANQRFNQLSKQQAKSILIYFGWLNAKVEALVRDERWKEYDFIFTTKKERQKYYVKKGTDEVYPVIK